MVINLTNHDVMQAFADYARRHLAYDFTGLEGIEFRTPRNADGYCIVVETKFEPEDVTPIPAIPTVSRMAKKTAVIPHAPILRRPSYLIKSGEPLIS